MLKSIAEGFNLVHDAIVSFYEVPSYSVWEQLNKAHVQEVVGIIIALLFIMVVFVPIAVVAICKLPK
jgi:hypothetical protein